ncbi:MAG TPA: lysylphosphatidylglycerol synthase transmembrane domain-containing protein [Candidatus Saccharimonadales bacterium]|nr:lysylphosphatidylglycerol synthase transmembrane domain-containing protein [Candidatus Saccharimonadales bacterium]
MKFRTWLNIITITLLALVIFFSWGQISRAWGLLGTVNLWIFVLMVPVQFLSYYSVGEVMFSYLRAKGELNKMTRWGMTRVALELNFVNHVIPVSGLAGFSYLGVVLRKHDVSAGRATMAQLIRYATMFIMFVLMILASVVVLIFDQKVSRVIIIISAAFVVATIISSVVVIYAISNRRRLVVFSKWFTHAVNEIVFKLSFGRKRNVLNLKKVEEFFTDIHQDYIEILSDKKILIRPLLWSLAGNIFDVSLIFIAFLALGFFVNPATLVIACGISSFTAIFAATPGGSGVYEAIMIAFLASAGVTPDVAIAGTLLARATVLAGTIIFGFIFYQLTIHKYGKIDKSATSL